MISCTHTTCYNASTCFRARSLPGFKYRMYFAFSPMNEDGTCNFYISMHKYLGVRKCYNSPISLEEYWDGTKEEFEEFKT